MSKPWKQPLSMAQALKATFKKLKMTSTLKRHEVFANWESIAGKKIAERAQPLKIHGNQLILEVDHPAWIQELNFLKPKLLEKISQEFPESRVRNLRFILK